MSDCECCLLIDREAEHCTEIDNDMFSLHDLASPIQSFENIWKMDACIDMQ